MKMFFIRCHLNLPCYNLRLFPRVLFLVTCEKRRVAGDLPGCNRGDIQGLEYINYFLAKAGGHCLKASTIMDIDECHSS